MASDIFIGGYRTDTHKYRVTVRLELRHTATPHEQETIHHELINSYEELSISGYVTERPLKGGRWRTVSAGQVHEELRHLTEFAPGWDAAKVRTLLAVWEEWHLNGMQGACAHMTPAPIGSTVLGVEIVRYKGRNDQSVTLEHFDVNKNLYCSLDGGYKYGSAWLVRPLDPQVVAWVNMINGES